MVSEWEMSWAVVCVSMSCAGSVCALGCGAQIYNLVINSDQSFQSQILLINGSIDRTDWEPERRQRVRIVYRIQWKEKLAQREKPLLQSLCLSFFLSSMRVSIYLCLFISLPRLGSLSLLFSLSVSPNWLSGLSPGTSLTISQCNSLDNTYYVNSHLSLRQITESIGSNRLA